MERKIKEWGKWKIHLVNKIVKKKRIWILGIGIGLPSPALIPKISNLFDVSMKSEDYDLKIELLHKTPF
ncbi:Bacteriophage CI repressor protein [Leptospira santarosai]|nr:Bacteriophage CI repressor protein [Leptospira santarosai]